MERTKTAVRPVMISDGTRLLSISLKEVCYLKADGNYTLMFFSNKRKPITLTRRIGELEKVLPLDSFVRVSRSDIINVWFVEMIIGRLVTMTDGTEITIGKTYGDVLADRFLILEEKRE